MTPWFPNKKKQLFLRMVPQRDRLINPGYAKIVNIGTMCGDMPSGIFTGSEKSQVI